ncbi:MAG: adenylate/guanylate cyclase domain-containing protein [Leptospiraceae bacterium]|nr:adenylate/guanylate cyclase domain-containing protein [Leptospiraceae bacterium]
MIKKQSRTGSFLFYFNGFRLSCILQLWERNSKPVLAFPRYVNAFIEVSLPSFVFYVIAELRSPFSIYAMLTPPLVVYFIFIIASGFRLDLKISIFTGGIAALEYLFLCVYYSSKNLPDLPVSYLVIFPSFVIRSLVLFASGIMVGYLTSQMQERLINNFSLVYEKDKITKIFGKHVSPQVAEKLVGEENVSETRFVCILFFDIRNFTKFAEARSPEEVVSFLNSIFEICIEIIEENNGIINKFLGDGFMAIFGAPISSERDTLNAINSAVEIKKVLSNTFKEINFGIGLHCGNTVVGHIGSETRKEYTVIGDVVNLASRIEQLNKNYNSQILLSKEVSLYSNNIPLHYIDKVKVKGREEEVEIYTTQL